MGAWANERFLRAIRGLSRFKSFEKQIPEWIWNLRVNLARKVNRVWKLQENLVREIFIKRPKDLKRGRPQFGQRKYSFAQTPTKLPALLAPLPAMSASAAVASASVAASIRASNVSIAHASRVSAAILRDLTETKVLRRPRAAIAVR